MADLSEPCPHCGCPGEQFDGHACEDFIGNPSRFYRREHAGHISESHTSRPAPMPVEVMVIDRDYCHRVVKSFMPPDAQGRKRSGLFGYDIEEDLEARRQEADELIDKLNGKPDTPPSDDAAEPDSLGDEA